MITIAMIGNVKRMPAQSRSVPVSQLDERAAAERSLTSNPASAATLRSSVRVELNPRSRREAVRLLFNQSCWSVPLVLECNLVDNLGTDLGPARYVVP